MKKKPSLPCLCCLMAAWRTIALINSSLDTETCLCLLLTQLKIIYLTNDVRRHNIAQTYNLDLHLLVSLSLYLFMYTVQAPNVPSLKCPSFISRNAPFQKCPFPETSLSQNVPFSKRPFPEMSLPKNVTDPRNRVVIDKGESKK